MRVYDGRFDKKIFPTKHTVKVISSNRVFGVDNDYMTIRKNGREDWSLFYCQNGCMYFDNCHIKENEVWIYPPNTPQMYMIYEKDKTIYYYLHFTGSDIDNLLRSLDVKLQKPIEIKSGSFSDIFENIIKCLEKATAKAELCAEYHTLWLLSKLVNDTEYSFENNLLSRVTDDMEYRISQKYDAKYYAGMMNLSVGRFNHIFKEQLGVAPYTYYLELRISNAKNLLEETNLKIKDISEKCGYEDQVYFSQSFKKSVGMTPSQYRKKQR